MSEQPFQLEIEAGNAVLRMHPRPKSDTLYLAVEVGGQGTSIQMSTEDAQRVQAWFDYALKMRWFDGGI